MEWLHPDFRGEVIRDDEDYSDWPMKHDWYATTQYPEGLWELRYAKRALYHTENCPESPLKTTY
jgi:hypothetical protein